MLPFGDIIKYLDLFFQCFFQGLRTPFICGPTRPTPGLHAGLRAPRPRVLFKRLKSTQKIAKTNGFGILCLIGLGGIL